MREGIPVIASDIAPHQQLIAANRGILFHTGDIDALCDSLSWAINHSQELKRLAANAQNYVKAYYSWEHISTKHLRLYKNMLQSNQPNQTPRFPTS